MSREIMSLKAKNDEKDNEIERLKKQIIELNKSSNLEPIKIKKSKIEIINTLFDDVISEGNIVVEKNNTDEINNTDETVKDSIFNSVFSEITKIPEKKKNLFKNKNNLKN